MPATTLHLRTRHCVTRPCCTYGSASDEGLDRGRVVHVEDQHRAVDRLVERTGQHEVAPLACRLREREVLRSQRGTPRHVVVHDVIEQQVVHQLIIAYGGDLRRAVTISGGTTSR